MLSLKIERGKLVPRIGAPTHETAGGILMKRDPGMTAVDQA